MIDDKQFSELLKRQLPQAPHSPWFTRKVINRLPDRSTSGIERAAYLLGALAVVAYMAVMCVDIASSGFTVSMLCGAVASTVILVSMACSIVRAKL